MCGLDEVVTGGGRVIDLGADFTFRDMKAVSGPPAEWFVEAVAASQPSSFHAVAECAKLVDAP